MLPFNKCPVCDGEMTEKEVETLLRGGNNTATVKVLAEVCLKCGERLYSKATITRFEEIRRKLQDGETGEFRLLGKSYHVA